ncbi:MAG: hypothetical protein L6R45_25135 [Anaerolineae bacterium]|nr:hypothetical protein [Anaerolineae bacterium]
MRGNAIKPKANSKNSRLSLWLAFLGVALTASFFRFYELANHPLGLFFDPAINGLDAIRLMQRGGPVLFFPTNGGREALLVYLLIPFIWLFGPNPFAFRLQLAIISLLNVVCLFAFLREWRMTNGEWPQNVVDDNSIHHSQFTIHNSLFIPQGYPFGAIWFAALAGLTLAVSPWHIAISRGDQRPLTVPLLAVLVFWFFLKGWSGDQKRWFVLSGLFLGLSFHTYSAARLLPIILLAVWLPELFLRNTQHATRITHHVSRMVLLALPALLVAAPLLWYFAIHPAQFSARAASVMVWAYLDTPSAVLAELGRNLLRVLGFFCCAGSPNAIFGLPSAPGLAPWLAPFLLLGLINALKNWRTLFYRLVALWWLIGISPSIIAIEAPHPLRMIVALPATAILIALGFGYVARLTFHVSHLTPHASRLTLYVLPFLLILATVPGVFSAYFVEWPRLPVTQGIYDYGAVAIRDAVLAQADPARPIYLPLAGYNDQPLLFYLSDTFRREAALSAPPADSALVIAPEKNERDSVWVRLQGQTAVILPPLTVEGQHLIQNALAGDSTQAIRTPRGEQVATLAPLRTDPARFLQQPTHLLTATFGPAQLIGATYPTILDPIAATLDVTLYWQANSPMPDEFEAILQLVDDSRRVWGDGTARPNDWAYPTPFWRPGLDTIAAQQVIRLLDSPPPGRYWLAVALFNPATGQRLPLTEGQSDSPDTFFIGPLKMPLPTPPPLPSPQGQEVTFGEVAQLLAYTIEPPHVATGESIQVNLLWQALTTPPLDYTIFIHLLDAAGKQVAGSDAQPVNNTYPTTIWTPGERILDSHLLSIPNTLSPGQYHLAVGLYHQPTGQRLPLHFPDDREDTANQLMLTPFVTIIAKH